jgi:hypothetical protein
LQPLLLVPPIEVETLDAGGDDFSSETPSTGADADVAAISSTASAMKVLQGFAHKLLTIVTRHESYIRRTAT